LSRDPQSRPEQSRSRRLEKYQQTHALRGQGYLIQDIAHHLGIWERTVHKYLAASTFPERQPNLRARVSGLDRYKPVLVQQWNQGQTEGTQLFRAIQALGYKGSYMTVARYVRQLCQSESHLSPESLNDLPGRGPAPMTQQPPLTARRAAWLVISVNIQLYQSPSTLLKAF
jgi:hypothetical protein